jgi:hypothetical protein
VRRSLDRPGDARKRSDSSAAPHDGVLWCFAFVDMAAAAAERPADRAPRTPVRDCEDGD